MLANRFNANGRAETWTIHANGGMEGTPMLVLAPLTDVSADAIFRVVVNFCARGEFYYQIRAEEGAAPLEVDGNPVATGGVVVARDGWQAISRSAFFRRRPSSQSAVVFFAEFVKGDLTGEGTLNNFLIFAEVAPKV